MANPTPDMKRVIASLRARLNKESTSMMVARSGTWLPLT